jgi:hypothetical protein
MSATVHVVQHYSTSTPMVMQACDHLMAELLRREAQNSSVRRPTCPPVTGRWWTPTRDWS